VTAKAGSARHASTLYQLRFGWQTGTTAAQSCSGETASYRYGAKSSMAKCLHIGKGSKLGCALCTHW